MLEASEEIGGISRTVEHHGNRIDNWQAYNLPPPRPGYAYYYDPSGDVVMAAIASGIIGLVIGGALAGQDHDHDHDRRPH